MEEKQDDAKDITEALQSTNTMKVFAGVTAFKALLEKKQVELAGHINIIDLPNQRHLLDEIVRGKSTLIKNALLHKPDERTETMTYHIDAF